MSYNIERIRTTAAQLRLAFIKKTVLLAAAAAASILLIALYHKIMAVFIIAAAALIATFCAFIKSKRRLTVSMRRRDLGGIILKAHLEARGRASHAGRRGLSFRKISNRRYAMHAQLTVREECGDVEIIDGLSGAQLEAYEVGDRILRIAGTKYPIILERISPRTKWVCPICGGINADQAAICEGCKLEPMI